MNKLLSILLLFLTISVSGQNFFWSHTFVSNDTVPCKNYGLLYNWYAVTDVRNITSSDTWVVPDSLEIENLLSYIDVKEDLEDVGGLNMWMLAGGKLKKTGLDYWETPNDGATNEYNFSAVGSGSVDGDNFNSLNQLAYIHTSTVGINPGYPDCDLTYVINAYDASVELGYMYKRSAGSVRIMRAATAPELLLSDGTFVDDYVGNDLRTYKAVKINDKIWLAQNLAETKFRTGAIIPFHGEDNDSTFTGTEWDALITAGCAAYDNDVNNVACGFEFPVECTDNGLIYNLYAVSDARHISASGWEVPDMNDFRTLFEYIDNESPANTWANAGGYLKETGTTWWQPTNIGATNAYNFSARATFNRIGGWDGSFNGSYYWMNEGGYNNAVTMFYHSSSVDLLQGGDPYFGMSIRLVRPATVPELLLADGSYVDDYTCNDLVTTHPAVKIGTQVWLAENLAETKFRNGDIIPYYSSSPSAYYSQEEWDALETSAMCAFDNNPNTVYCGFTFPTEE